MNDKLYIIGNGFDLCHSIPSSYRDFHNWCGDNWEDLCNRIDLFYENPGDLWRDFEGSLGNIDVMSVIDDARFFVPNGISSYRELYQYQDAIKDSVDALLYDIGLAFEGWVRTLCVARNRVLQPRVYINPDDALFITFNYTDTLERLYSISDDRIFHIHGKVDSRKQNSRLIFGHGLSLKEIEERVALGDDEEFLYEDEPIQEVIHIIGSFRKPVEECISSAGDFFHKLKGVLNVYIIGHSCSLIDYPYFYEIRRHVQKDAKWTATFYSEGDKESIAKLFENLGLHTNQTSCIKTERLSELWDPTLF